MNQEYTCQPRARALASALSYISRNNEWRKGAKSVTETFSSCTLFLFALCSSLVFFFLFSFFILMTSSFFFLSLFFFIVVLVFSLSLNVRRFYDVNCQKIRPYQTDAAPRERELCNYYFSTFVSVSNSKCFWEEKKMKWHWQTDTQIG